MYSRLVLWMDKDILVSRKIDFYDRDGTHVKTLAQTDLRNIGPIPTAHHIEMRSLKKGSRTEAELSDVAYDPGLSNDFFTERYLKRGAP